MFGFQRRDKKQASPRGMIIVETYIQVKGHFEELQPTLAAAGS
jgi:hypothetical protein